MKEKLLLAIVITFALSFVQGMSSPSASRPTTPDQIEELNPKSIAQLMQDY